MISDWQPPRRRQPRWWPRRGALAIAWILTLAGAPQAAAYRLFATDRDTCGEELPLRFSQIPIPFAIARAGTPDLPIATVELAVNAAFEAWERPELSYATFEYEGLIDAELEIAADGFGEPRFGFFSPPHNVVAFQDSNWPDELHGARAVTFALVHTCGGELLQTDIIINDTYTDWYAGDFPPGWCESCFDLQNIVTHEVGHLLGIAHTDVAGATMNICDQPGAEVTDCVCVRNGQTCARSLEADDLAALEALYPLGQAPEPSTHASGIGETCRHSGDCLSAICAPSPAGPRVCTDQCDGASDCPAGLACIPAPDDLRQARVCWYGPGLMGEPCADGCESGLCFDELCTELCGMGHRPCPQEWSCVELAGRGVCRPPEPAIEAGPELPDAGTTSDGRADTDGSLSDAAAPQHAAETGPGCNCRVGPRRAPASWAVLALLGVVVLRLAQRRMRERRRARMSLPSLGRGGLSRKYPRPADELS